MDDFHVDFDMPGLPPALSQRLDKTLQDCGEFQSHAALRGVFIDARLKLWRAELPEAFNLKERVAAVKDYLYERFNQGVNGLCLLLWVLRDSRDPDDDLHHRLSDLAAEMEALQLGAQAKAAVKQAAHQPAQLQAARTLVQRWLALAPDHAEAATLLAQLDAQEDAIRKAQEEAERKAREEVDRKAKEAEEARRKTQEAEETRRRKQAAEEAARKAREEQERQAQARLTELCAQMQAAADRQDWPDVLRLAEQVQGLQPGDANAAQWVAYARDQVRRIAVPPPPVITQPSPVVGRPSAVARKPFEPELILIPAGEFLMGSDKKMGLLLGDELPQHEFYLPDYYIAKAPTTNAQYAVFVEATGYQGPSHWKNGRPPQSKQDHPVVNVSWNDAMAYCKWLAEVTGKPYTLPSEAEWEKAARGTDGRLYPWGNALPDKTRCNFSSFVSGLVKASLGLGDTTSVEKYSPYGDSPYGCVDMAGNVLEWTRSIFKAYPYDPTDGRENLDASVDRVLRGGAFFLSGGDARCAFRRRDPPQYCLGSNGFRVSVVSPFSLPDR